MPVKQRLLPLTIPPAALRCPADAAAALPSVFRADETQTKSAAAAAPVQTARFRTAHTQAASTPWTTTAAAWFVWFALSRALPRAQAAH